MGRFSSQKSSEGRGYLQVFTLPLEIKIWAPSVPRSQVRYKGLSDKEAPGAVAGVGAPVFVSIECQSRCQFTGDSGGRGLRGLGEGIIPNVRV